MGKKPHLGLLNNGGNIGKELKGLTDKDFIKSFVISVAAAGITGGICEKLDIKLPTAEQMKTMSTMQIFTAQLDYNLTRSLVNATVTSIVGNKNFGKELVSGLKGAVINSVGATAAGEIEFARDHSKLRDRP